jgi:hypothetical protein
MPRCRSAGQMWLTDLDTADPGQHDVQAAAAKVNVAAHSLQTLRCV